MLSSAHTECRIPVDPFLSDTGPEADILRDTAHIHQAVRHGAGVSSGPWRDYNDRMSTSAPTSFTPFDTHRFVKRMTGAGMPLAQAEALAEEQGVMANTHFATKQDTGELKIGLANVEQDVGELKQDTGELKIGLAVVRAELTMVKWMVSGVGFGMLLLLVRTFWPA